MNDTTDKSIDLFLGPKDDEASTSESPSGDGVNKRRLSAIMFTDIRGFTSMMETNEAMAVGLVKAHREIVRKYIAAHNGEERETIGDAFLVIFDSALNAVRCAIEIQQGLWEFNRGKAEDEQVWIRVGIHLGDILIEAGSVFGEGVNLAARVEPLAEAGGVCITQPVYEQVRHHLEIDVKRLGVRDLKNVSDVPNLYHIVLPTTAPKPPQTFADKIYDAVCTPCRIAIAATIAALIAASLVYWFFFAQHIVFSRQVAYVNHRPIPRFEISSRDARGLEHSFKIIYRGLKVVEVREVTKPDIFPRDIKPTIEVPFAKKPKREFPIHRYTYENNEIREDEAYDQFGAFQYKYVFDKDGKLATLHDKTGHVKTFENQIATFAYEFDDNGYAIKVANMNAFGMYRADSSGASIYRYSYDKNGLPVEVGTYDSLENPIENKDRIAFTSYVYDERGLPIKESYMDRYKAINESVSGIAVIETQYDQMGRKVLERYFDRAEQLAIDNDGVCGTKFSHDGEGRLLTTSTISCEGAPKSTKSGYASARYEYGGNRVIAEYYYDESLNPTNDSNGVALIRVGYDDIGRYSTISFFGADGSNVLRNQAHTINFYWDQQGRLVRQLSLDRDGTPTKANGFAEIRIQYNSRDDITEFAYFDSDGNHVNRPDGFALIRMDYDQFGNTISESFYDKNDEPARGNKGACHRLNMSFDDRGNASEVRCYDVLGKLTPSLKNCAIIKYDYNALGKIEKFQCYIDEGKLIEAPNLPAVLTIKYDERGFQSEVMAYDSKGELAERWQGAAIWKQKTDRFGNELEIATYDRFGNPIENPKFKASIFRREFDDRGHVMRVQSFDKNGNAIKGIGGFAELRYAYDARGNMTSESFFSEDGSPTHNWQGVHERRMKYDDQGRLIETASLDEGNQPVLNNLGYAYERNEYDKFGLISKTSYFDVGENPVSHRRLKSAAQGFVRDEKGNIKEVRLYDVGGNLCSADGCTAITEQTFNAKGQLTRRIFRNADGARTVDEYLAGGYEYGYDIQQREAVEHVLAADDSHGIDKRGVHEYHLNYNPRMDFAVWYITFFDRDGKATKSLDGADLRIVFYDPVYNRRERARVDLALDGSVKATECLDEAGNPTDDKGCIGVDDISSELGKIRTLLGDMQK